MHRKKDMPAFTKTFAAPAPALKKGTLFAG
jgi:hypothetical protein